MEKKSEKEDCLDDPLNSSIITFANKDNHFSEDLSLIQSKLKSKSELIECPYCRNENNTKIESSISCCAVSFYLSGLIILPFLIQVIRKKGNCISIVKHYCGSCNNLLYVYKPVCG